MQLDVPATAAAFAALDFGQAFLAELYGTVRLCLRLRPQPEGDDFLLVLSPRLPVKDEWPQIVSARANGVADTITFENLRLKPLIETAVLSARSEAAPIPGALTLVGDAIRVEARLGGIPRFVDAATGSLSTSLPDGARIRFAGWSILAGPAERPVPILAGLQHPA
jgi:hypothetical protein